MSALRVLSRHLGAACLCAVTVSLVHGAAMLFRDEVWEEATLGRVLEVVLRLLVAEAGILVAFVALLGVPVLLAGLLGYRRWATRAALVAQVLLVTGLVFFSAASFSHYRHTGGFLLRGDLRVVQGDFSHVAKELHGNMFEFLQIVVGVLVGSIAAGWPLRWLADACVRLRTVALRPRVHLGVLGCLALVAAASVELSNARPGLVSRIVRHSTPELALLHEIVLDHRAGKSIAFVVPDELDLVPVEPMERYLDRAAPEADAPRWNVLLLVLESVPASRTGPYGHSRDTTPNMDRIARESIVFERAQAVASSSSYAQLAVLSSLYPLKYYVRDEYRKLNYPRTLIWDVLKPLGWNTAVISSQDERWNNMHRFVGTKHLDLLYHSPKFEGEKVNHRERVFKIPDRFTVDRALRWFDEESREPFALYVNLQGTHYPYLEVPGCPPRFHPHAIDFPFPYMRWPKDKKPIVTNVFDNALHCIDQQVGRIYDALRERGLLERTILVVTADHGEGFYEHSSPNHGYSLYDEQLHVPLLIRAPRIFPPSRFKPTISQLDILPTILAGMGFSEVHPNFQGVNVLDPGYTDRGRDFCATVQYGRNLTSLMRNGKKLIRNIATGRQQLFDVEADPGERRPLKAYAVTREYRRRLITVLQRQLTYYADSELSSNYYPPRITSEVPLSRWKPVGVRLGFEGGRYSPDWTVDGKAFGDAPSTIAALGPFKKQAGFRGKFFATSFKDRRDGHRGELLSRSFPIVGERMRLLVGGGDDWRKVGVELLVDGNLAYRTAGQGADGFNPVWWDISRYRGKSARVRVYDRSKKRMGHILVDDIRQFVRDRTFDDGE